MSREESHPPRSAIWLLRHACPGSHNQALTGDLVEKFREGRSHGWFWKQVLIAIAVGVLGEIQRHWPHFCYAIAGTAMPALFGKTIEVAPALLHWWVLPWPLSQLLLEWTPRRSACLGGIACPGGCAGDQRSVSLGQPASDGYDLPGPNQARTLSARCLPLVTPSYGGQSPSQDPYNPTGLRDATVLFHLPHLGVAGLPIASTRQ
jgi:hypothetical protein